MTGQQGRHHMDESLLENGYDIRTTMIYTHVLNRGAKDVVSPLDGILGGDKS